MPSRLPRPPFIWRIAHHAAMAAPVLALMVGQPTLAAELGAELPGLLDYARTQNPELASMKREAEAAAQRIQPAGALPDPVLRVALENVNNYGNGGGFNLLPGRVGETRYTLMQALPAWGKRDLRREVAAADAKAVDARVSVTWTELAMRIKSVYAQYYQNAAVERLTREVLDLMARLEQIAQVRYQAGLAAQQDAIRAQLEQTALSNDLIMLANEKRQLRARLNALLGREGTAPLAEAQSLRALPTDTTLGFEALLEHARRTNPVLRAETARVQGAEHNRDLVWRNRWPDFNVGVAPAQMGNRLTTMGVMVELNIPLQQQTRRSQEREALAMVEAARARAEAVVNQFTGELGEQLSALTAARQAEALVRTHQLPQSELTLKSALASYETGKVDFATLLDAQRATLKAQQDLVKTQAEARMRLAEIERIVGDEL